MTGLTSMWWQWNWCSSECVASVAGNGPASRLPRLLPSRVPKNSRSSTAAGQEQWPLQLNKMNELARLDAKLGCVFAHAIGQLLGYLI